VFSPIPKPQTGKQEHRGKYADGTVLRHEKWVIGGGRGKKFVPIDKVLAKIGKGCV